MGFLLGFLMGLLTAIGLLGFLIYWSCSRSNNIAVAKFINGIAQALASINKAKSLEPLAPGKDGKATERAREERAEKTKGEIGHERRYPDEIRTS
jgi:hypothetical protein